MDKQIALTILQFLERSNIVGKEVPAFVSCINELQKVINEKPEAPKPES